MLPILRRPPEMCGTYSFLFVRIETLLVSCRSPRSFLTSINFTSSPHLKLISPRSTRRVQPPCAGRRTRIILNAFMESKRRSESCKSELRKSEERNSGRNSTYSHILPWNLFDSSLCWCDRMGICTWNCPLKPILMMSEVCWKDHQMMLQTIYSWLLDFEILYFEIIKIVLYWNCESMHCDGVEVARQMEMEKTPRELCCPPRQNAAVVQFLSPKAPNLLKGCTSSFL